MNDNKFADLDQEQLQVLNELEEKLGVTLVAYDSAASFTNATNANT
ncbi:hypothetical protein [Psychrobacillus sp. L3]